MSHELPCWLPLENTVYEFQPGPNCLKIDQLLKNNIWNNWIIWIRGDLNYPISKFVEFHFIKTGTIGLLDGSPGSVWQSSFAWLVFSTRWSRYIFVSMFLSYLVP